MFWNSIQEILNTQSWQCMKNAWENVQCDWMAHT